MSDALGGELEPFGGRVTLVEPRVYATGFVGPSMKLAEFEEEYLPVRAALMEKYGGGAPGCVPFRCYSTPPAVAP